MRWWPPGLSSRRLALALRRLPYILFPKGKLRQPGDLIWVHSVHCRQRESAFTLVHVSYVLRSGHFVMNCWLSEIFNKSFR